MKHIDLSSIRFDEYANKFKDWKKIVLVLGWVVVLLVGGGIFWSMFSGLVAIIATASLALAAMEFLPWLALKTANIGTKLIKHEAAVNPVETLKKVHSDNAELLDQKLSEIQALQADWLSFKQDTDDFKARFPEEDHSKDDELIDVFRTQLQSCIADHQAASEELRSFAYGIEKAQARWAIAIKSAKLSEQANQSTSGQWNNLLKDTSMKAIEHKTNSALAKLDTTLLANGRLKEKLSARYE